MPSRTRVTPTSPPYGPALEDERPLPVVGELVAPAQTIELGDRRCESVWVPAELRSDCRVGEGDGNAVGMVGGAGPADGIGGTRRCPVLVSEKPVGVCRPPLAVHVEAGPNKEGDVRGRELDGQVEVLRGSGRIPQGQDRAREGEMGLGGELGVASCERRGPGRRPRTNCSVFPWTKRVPKSATRLRTRSGVSPQPLGEEHRLLECRLDDRRGVTVEGVRGLPTWTGGSQVPGRPDRGLRARRR